MKDKVVQVILLLCFVLCTTVAIAAVYKNGQDSTKEPSTVDMNASKNMAEQEVAKATEETTRTAQRTAQDAAANADVVIPNFSAESRLAWPIQGNILMGFSMDTTVYYSTLKQYKVSPAVLIQGEVGIGVAAPADAQIVSIGSNEEIGNYVILNLGNGYQAKIGNLKDITVQEGQFVRQGNILGAISDPTAYYSVEGPNVYFQLLNGETPIDPLDYLQ